MCYILAAHLNVSSALAVGNLMPVLSLEAESVRRNFHRGCSMTEYHVDTLKIECKKRHRAQIIAQSSEQIKVN
jgi:hypothetical protein